MEDVMMTDCELIDALTDRGFRKTGLGGGSQGYAYRTDTHLILVTDEDGDLPRADDVVIGIYVLPAEGEAYDSEPIDWQYQPCDESFAALGQVLDSLITTWR